MKERCEWQVIPSGLVISHATQLPRYTFTRPYDLRFQYSAYTAQYTYSTADRMDVVVGQILRSW